MPAKELVEFVARSLVDDPDAVKVEVVRDRDGTVLELHVAEDDMGKVIGRNGSVAKALRTLLKVTAARDGEPVSLEILSRTTTHRAQRTLRQLRTQPDPPLRPLPVNASSSPWCAGSTGCGATFGSRS